MNKKRSTGLKGAWQGAPGKLAVSALAVGMGMVAASPAHAALGGRPGQTLLQSNTGTAVQDVCVNLSAPSTALETELAARCTEMVHTVNELDGLTGGAIAQSLGLTEEEVNAGLQQLAGEEIASVGSLATETSYGQTANIAARLSALRGAVTGMHMSGLQSDSLYADATLDRLQRGDSGGSAGGMGDGRLSGFVNGSLGTGEKDGTPNEDGFEYDNRSVTAGVDYRFSDNFVGGVAVGYSTYDSDFDATASSTVTGGSVESDGYSVSGYGTWYRDNWYLEGVVSISNSDVDADRQIIYPTQNRVARAATDSDQWLVSFGGGYDMESGGITYTPYARLSISRTELDAYNETGAAELNLSVPSQDIDSTVSVIGVQVSKAISRQGGVMVPQGWVEWHHEFDDDSRTINTTYVNDPNQFILPIITDESDSDYFTLGVGVSGVFAGGTQAFASVEALLGLDDISETVFSFGVRHEF